MLYKSISGGATQDVELAKGTAVLKFSTYNSLDRDGDRSNKGMFAKSWKEGFTDIRFLLNHDPKNPMGLPGKPLEFWEKDDGAYCLVKFGGNTLGKDCLTMVDEKIIETNSFGFDIIKSLPIKDKGKDFKEVKQWELSILTGWPAHPGSTVQAVKKGKKDYYGTFSIGDWVSVIPGEEHMSSHAGVKMLIIDRIGYDYGACYQVMLPDGTKYKWYSGAELVPIDDTELADEGDDTEKAADLDLQIKALEKFCRNTKASDASIKIMQVELEDLKSAKKLLNDTAITTPPITEPDASVNNAEFVDALQLLTLNF